jgi:hypothetical protein
MTDEALAAHYAAVATLLPVPVLVYYVPKSPPHTRVPWVRMAAPHERRWHQRLGVDIASSSTAGVRLCTGGFNVLVWARGSVSGCLQIGRPGGILGVGQRAPLAVLGHLPVSPTEGRWERGAGPSTFA